MDTPTRLVMFANADERTAWHTILTVGEKRGTPMAGPGHVKFKRADLEELAASFARDLPVDVNHATGAGALDAEHTKARGWIKALRVVDDALQAMIEWTDEGAKFIKDGAFRFFSIELARSVDQETGKPASRKVIGGTLTNHPFWDLPALALSQDVSAAISGMQSETAGNPGAAVAPTGSTSAPHEEDPMPDLIERLAEVQPGITEDQAVTMLAEVSTLRETIATRDADAVKLTEARDTLQAEVDALKTDKTAANGEIVSLSERLGKMEAGLTAAREAATLDADMQRNALSTAEAGTADEPGVARKLHRLDVELYAEAYGNRPDNYATTGGGKSGTTATAPKAPATDVPDYSTVTTQDAAEDMIVSLAERYMEEHADVDYTTAEQRIVRDINEAKPGDGDRLHTLMMEV